MRKKIIWGCILFLSVFFTGCGGRGKDVYGEITPFEFEGKELKSEDIKDDMIFRPYFGTVDGNYKAGTAFVVKNEEWDMPLGVTAKHVLEILGEVKNEDLMDFMRAAQMYDAYDNTHVFDGGEFLYIEEPKTEEPISMDLAAFHVPYGKDLTAFEISDRELKKGESVWVISAVIEGNGFGKKIHKAKFVEYNDGYMTFDYEDPISLWATSGSPVVDSEGKVVGLNVSGNDYEEATQGYANPGYNILNLLETAMKNEE